jgi:hypothetical protein
VAVAQRRSGGGGGEEGSGASRRSVSKGIGPVNLLGFSTVNLGSRASYRHDGRVHYPQI